MRKLTEQSLGDQKLQCQLLKQKSSNLGIGKKVLSEGGQNTRRQTTALNQG